MRALLPKQPSGASVFPVVVGRVGALLCGVVLCACQPKPQPDSAFAGPPASKLRCEDGLEVYTVHAGKGAGAKYGELAQIHYIARIQGGTEISRSHDRNASYVPVGRKGSLVEGMHRGLMGMKVGELRRIVVPEDLGYRGRKVPGVPPGAVLEFWVEMFDLSPATTPSEVPKGFCPSP